ncbi:hypothetical protein D9M72_549600 [compost metagenome]
MRVEPVPAFPGGVFHAALLEQGDDGVRVRVLCRRQSQPVFEQAADGLQGVALGVPDQAHRPALDPAGGVDSRNGVAVGIQHAAALVGNHACPGVVFEFLQRRAVVPDGPVDGLDRVVDVLPCALDVAGAVQLHPLKLDARHLAGARRIAGGVVNLHRAVQEVQVEPP